MDLPKYEDLFAIGANQVLVLNGNLTSESVFRDGSDINIDVAAAAAIGDECIGQLTNVAAGNFLDSSNGTVLDRLLFDRYGLLRNPSAPAIGSVQFQVTLGGAPVASPVSFAIPVGTVLQTSSGEQFITTAAAVYQIGATAPLVVAIQSVLAGADQQAAVGTINSLTSTIAGAPQSPYGVAVTNVLATAGASDEESDSSFRGRGRQFFATARRGTDDAIEQGALAVPGVTSATVFEVINILGQPARALQLVITDTYTDALAQLSSVPPTYQQQSQVLAQNVFNALADVRAAGIYVQVTVAQVIMQPVQLNLSFNAGANNLPGGIDAVALSARAAVVMYTNSLAPGVPWTPAGALASLRAIPGLQITGNEIASPPGVVTPNPLQVIRTTLAIVLAVAVGTGAVLNASLNPDALAA